MFCNQKDAFMKKKKKCLLLVKGGRGNFLGKPSAIVTAAYFEYVRVRGKLLVLAGKTHSFEIHPIV